MSIKSPGSIAGQPVAFSTITATAAAPTVAANQIGYGATVAGTASAGAATLPANPVGFIVVNIAGTPFKIPYYAA